MLKKGLLLFSILLLLGTAACQTAGSKSVVNPHAGNKTATVPADMLQSSPTAAPTSIPCTQATGSIKNIDIPASQLSHPINVYIYLPPCYAVNSQEEYPTLYMLHGQAGSNDQWIEIGLTDAADQLITEKKIPPLIIVMPDEEEWQSGPESSNFGKALIEDVIPFIQDHYRSCPARSCRAVGGFSRGGNWAVYLGFSHPEVFSAVGAHSTPLFYGEVGRIESKIESMNTLTTLPEFYIDVGKKDEQKQKVLDFVELLKELGVGYEFHQNEGRHEIAYWNAHVDDYLLWYSAQFSKTASAAE
jgi:enterochelin esterase-like enzyme